MLRLTPAIRQKLLKLFHLSSSIETTNVDKIINTLYTVPSLNAAIKI